MSVATLLKQAGRTMMSWARTSPTVIREIDFSEQTFLRRLRTNASCLGDRDLDDLLGRLNVLEGADIRAAILENFSSRIGSRFFFNSSSVPTLVAVVRAHHPG